jgi:hypothetical protein
MAAATSPEMEAAEVMSLLEGRLIASCPGLRHIVQDGIARVNRLPRKMTVVV